MRRTLLILAVAALPAVVLVLLYRVATPPPRAAPPPPAPRPTDSTWPLAVPVAVTTGPTVTAAPPTSTVAPFVPTFGGRSSASPLPRLPSPTAALSMPVNVDGCDRSYGTRSQCVPWRFPPGVTDGCGWLRERGFLDTPLTVRGADRHRLDPDRNGFACS
ncbi:hypothetical protein [Actinoplanes sp. G11-F43]|uniref:hypothetical protein n=1 Tax=Actinoplanes sp. G11-F43 TaxID=3424130 RepID=UPI003D355B74